MTSADTLPGERRNTASNLRIVLIVGAAALVLLALYGRIMGFDIRRDELMFVPPAGLPDEWALYRDVFYNHVPYSAYLFGAFADVSTLGLLGSARLAVFAAWIALLAATWTVTARLAGSWLVALTSVAMLVANETLLSQVGATATNNFLPLPFALLGVGLFLISIVERDISFGRMFVVGFCLGIACGFKVSAVAFVLPIAVATFFAHRHVGFGERLRRVVLPVLTGGVIAGTPILVLLASDPALFLAHVVGFHTGPHIAFWNSAVESGAEADVAMGFGGKLQLAYGAWLSGSALLIAALIGSFAALQIARIGPRAMISNVALLVSLGTLATTSAMSFIPTPGFPQYYAPPLVVFPLILAVLARGLREIEWGPLRPALFATIVLMGVLGAPRLGPGLVTALHPERSTPNDVAVGGAALADIVAASAHPTHPVATLFPIYPLEAGLPVYPEFATGPFAYRIATVTEPSLAAHYVMAGPDDFAALFDATPPSAILVGYEPDLEAPFVAWASENGYTRIDAPEFTNRYGIGSILTKPAVPVRAAPRIGAGSDGFSQLHE